MKNKIKKTLNLWIKTDFILLCISVLICIMLTTAADDISTYTEMGLDTPPRLEDIGVILKTDKNVTEGQDFNLYIRAKNPKNFTDKPVFGNIKFIDLDYDYKTKVVVTKPFMLSSGKPVVRIKLNPRSCGHKAIICESEDGNVGTLSIKANPFRATVFPVAWEKYRNLDKDPDRWKLFINLYYYPSGQLQYLQIVHDNKILQRLLISSGRAGHLTPQGNYVLASKEYYPRSSLYNDTPMPFWNELRSAYIQGLIGIHGLEGESYMYLLGSPASHGCIRASRLPAIETDERGRKYWGDRGSAKWVFDRVPVNTKVYVFTRSVPVFTSQTYMAYYRGR